MKTVEDIRLESKVSDMLLDFADELVAEGGYCDMTTSDLQGWCMALAVCQGLCKISEAGCSFDGTGIVSV